MGRYDNELRRKRSRCNDLSSRAAVQGAGGGVRTAIPPCRGRVVRSDLGLLLSFACQQPLFLFCFYRLFNLEWG